MGLKRFQLSHEQFYLLVEATKAGSDGLSRTTSWEEAANFLAKQVKLLGGDFTPSISSVKTACGIAGVGISHRVKAGRRQETYKKWQDEIEILARAIAHLYDKLGEMKGPGLTRVLEEAKGKKPSDASNGYDPTTGLREPLQR